MIPDLPSTLSRRIAYCAIRLLCVLLVPAIHACARDSAAGENEVREPPSQAGIREDLVSQAGVHGKEIAAIPGSSSHGSVRVVVMNEDKQPMSGIPIEVAGPDRCRRARTGTDGTVTVDSLPLGLFKVRVLTPPDQVAAALPNGGGFRYAEVQVTEIDTYDSTVRFMLMRWKDWPPALSLCSPESIQRNVLPDTSPQG
jgi:hypothetical protein